MAYNTKTLNKLVNGYIKKSKTATCTVKDVENRDIFLALLDYLITRPVGYRFISKKHGISKHEFEIFIHTMPIKFDKKFAQKIYTKVLYNKIQNFDTPVLTPDEDRTLFKAYNTIKKRSYKYFDSLSEDELYNLLWN